MAENGQPDRTTPDPSNPLDLAKIAGLFAKWPGPMIMAVGMVLVFAATGVRGFGVEISGREFVGFEFGAVFFGGIVLIALGVAVLMLRERLLVADQERRVQQAHELKMEIGRAKVEANFRQQEALMRAGTETANLLGDADHVKNLYMSGYNAEPIPAGDGSP